MTESQKTLAALVEAMAQAGAFKTGHPAAIPEIGGVRYYPGSWQRIGRGALFMARTSAEKELIVIDLDEPFVGQWLSIAGHRVGLCQLTAENAAAIREVLPFTRPARSPADRPSFGCGDRLGLANPGHIRLLRRYQVTPVLAQQSIRELTLTNRTYQQVVDAASWAVLQEGYTEGFGADGDHLKSIEELRQALTAKVSMITLDLSLFLGSVPPGGPCPAELTGLAGQSFSYAGSSMTPTAGEIDEFWRTYGAALDFVAEADALCRSALGRDQYDLEISVDETAYTTRPLDHLLVVRELQRRGIAFYSLAPRFPGEFQKGIDYRGDLRQFEFETKVHAALAGQFGYKLSIHSGSDKFTVFPIIGRLTAGNFHEKTAGTSWLEALRVVALKDPGLFRRLYARSFEFFPAAKKYYHIATELEDVPGVDGMSDERLPSLLEEEAPRQFLHITYGQIMQAPELGPAILRLLHIEEEAYCQALERHFRRHADGLGIAGK